MRTIPILFSAVVFCQIIQAPSVHGMGKEPEAAPAQFSARGRTVEVVPEGNSEWVVTLQTGGHESLSLRCSAQLTTVMQGGIHLHPSELRKGDWLQVEGELLGGKRIARRIWIELPPAE
ncbi:MAG: hypothetical protein NC910_00060 [Candidatus Omnitrophica bacterium]|nr:hypothetical protein [Candidatus Omnitrophota bacterium]